MATKQEIAKAYANQIRASMAKKVVAKSAPIDIKDAVANEVRRIVAIADTITEIVKNLEDLEKNRRPLIEAEKEEIARLVGQELGLPDPEEFVGMTKAASNNAYMQLLSQVSGLIQNVRR